MTKDWDTYWTKEQTFFGKTLTFVRKNVITSELSRTLKKYFPQKKIVPIDSRIIIKGQGGIHCITQQHPMHSD